VPVATNRVTTISFPSAITAIDGAGITVDGKTPGLFQLAHTKGSAFLSVRALSPRRPPISTSAGTTIPTFLN
jgi:hypothetical protein